MKFSLLTLLRHSLLHRQSRALYSWLALTVSAGVATALLSLYSGLDAKLHHEFRSFGANVLVTLPQVDAAALDAIREGAGPGATLAPFGYAVGATAAHQPIVLVGTDFAAARRLNSWWQVSAWPREGSHAMLAGVRALPAIAAENQVATLSYGTRSQSFPLAGTLRTGGTEDSRVYLPLAAFTALTGTPATTVEVQIPGSAAVIDSAIARLHARLPAAEVHPIRQLVEGETRIVDRTRSLIFGSLVLISVMVAVSVLATLSASVLERRRDFAVLKALGSSQGKLQMLFLLEALVLGAGGVASGFVLGSLASMLIGRINFGAAIFPTAAVLLRVTALNLLVATVSALLPLRALRGLEPAALLRGE